MRLWGFRKIRPVLGLVLCLAAVPVVAQGTQVPEFLGLKDFPDARALVREYKPEQTYVLALSTYKKIGGTWSAEREQRISGDVLRRTLELPSDFSAREGFAFYEKQLEAYRLRELFACEQRECGGSINWANNHFNVIQLYGQDQHQYYSVYEVVRDDVVYYASLYSVRRGNQRVYVQLDLVRTPETDRPALALNPATLGKSLRDAGFFVLPGFDGHGARLACETMLPLKRGWRSCVRSPACALVGYDYGAGSLEAGP